jgi:hypothetical protein
MATPSKEVIALAVDEIHRLTALAPSLASAVGPDAEARILYLALIGASKIAQDVIGDE